MSRYTFKVEFIFRSVMSMIVAIPSTLMSVKNSLDVLGVALGSYSGGFILCLHRLSLPESLSQDVLFSVQQ